MRMLKETGTVSAFVNPLRRSIGEAVSELHEIAERSDESAKSFSMNCGKYSRECLEKAAEASAIRRSIEVLTKHLEVVK